MSSPLLRDGSDHRVARSIERPRVSIDITPEMLDKAGSVTSSAERNEHPDELHHRSKYARAPRSPNARFMRAEQTLATVEMRRGPQIVTRRGVEMAVLVRVDQWRQLEGDATRPKIKDLLLASSPRAEIPVPPRRARRRREPPALN